jgi:hypothetical protein
MGRGLKGQNEFKDLVGNSMQLALLGAMLLVAAGCGTAQDSNRLPVYPATGKISVKGSAPEGAYIALYSKTKIKAPNGQEVVPTAQVKPDGTFELSSYAAGDGAPPGEYIVTVQWHKTIKPVGGDPTLGPNLVPTQYSKPQTSPVVVTIAEQPNELKTIVIK